jgi:hypothetical protein
MARRAAAPPAPAIRAVEALGEPLAPGQLTPVSEPGATPTRRARRPRTGIPLDVNHEAGAPDGFEVLSAAELDAISQADN